MNSLIKLVLISTILIASSTYAMNDGRKEQQRQPSQSGEKPLQWVENLEGERVLVEDQFAPPCPIERTPAVIRAEQEQERKRKEEVRQQDEEEFWQRLLKEHGDTTNTLLSELLLLIRLSQIHRRISAQQK